MAEETKWEGKATAKVNGVSADKVWPLLEDYCNIHKWIPNIDSARLEEGEPGKLGCVRYCAGPPIPGTETPTFTNEKLVAFDPEKMSLSYEVLENNVGFNKFVATITVVPEEEGCTIEWSFVSDPAPHWSVEKIMGYIGYSVQYMAQTIEQELKPKQGDGGKKWAGKTSAKVAGASADSVWSLLSDFCTIYKWLPNLESTRLVEGESGKLGCVRHSDGPPLPGATAKSFTYEKLVAFDPAQRTLSYEVLENNIGFGFFMGTLKVLASGDKECTIEWSFTADPMTSWTEEQIQEYVAYEVQTMASRMAEALQSK